MTTSRPTPLSIDAVSWASGAGAIELPSRSWYTAWIQRPSGLAAVGLNGGAAVGGDFAHGGGVALPIEAVLITLALCPPMSVTVTCTAYVPAVGNVLVPA